MAAFAPTPVSPKRTTIGGASGGDGVDAAGAGGESEGGAGRTAPAAPGAPAGEAFGSVPVIGVGGRLQAPASASPSRARQILGSGFMGPSSCLHGSDDHRICPLKRMGWIHQ